MKKEQGEFSTDQSLSAEQLYLKELKLKSPSAKLDRSEFFRYPEDQDVIQQTVNERIGQGQITRFLDIGVGNMEEPLSYLVAAQKSAKTYNLPLADAVDLELIDIRPKNEVNVKYGLGKSSESGLGKAFMSDKEWTNVSKKPIMPRPNHVDSFELSADSGEYEFSDEIKHYIDQRMSDPSKAKFNQSIEEYIQNYSGEGYDVVACNNVLQHLGGLTHYNSPFKDRGQAVENYQRYFQVVDGILNLVKPGGIAIIHTEGSIKSNDMFGKHASEDILPMSANFNVNFIKIKSGIYKKLTEGNNAERES